MHFFSISSSSNSILSFINSNWHTHRRRVIVAAFAPVILNNESLKCLCNYGSVGTAVKCWEAVGKSALEEFSIFNDVSSGITDDDILLLGDALLSNSSLKTLELSGKHDQDDTPPPITAAGWDAFFGYLSNNRISLESLHIRRNNINNESIVSLADTLSTNTKLRYLDLSGNNGITQRGWNALANILCNKSNAETLYTSSHTLRGLWSTLHGLWSSPDDDTNVYLKLNENDDKVEVARQKILRYHFKNGEDNIDELVDMEMNVLPQVMSWMGRDYYSGQSLLYSFIRSMPTLFDSESMQVRAVANH